MTNRVFDKLVLFVSCLAVYLIAVGSIHAVPIILVVSVSAFNSYFEQRRFLRCTVTAFFLLSLAQAQYVYFLPLVAYDLMLAEGAWFLPLVVVPIALHGNRAPATGSVLVLLFLCVAWLMNQRAHTLTRLQSEYTNLRDTTKELLLSLESKNRELLEKQDYEINLATLNERNRIAREIHDHVGHVISSTLLQIGALLVVTQDANMREGLTRMKDALDKGLYSIRVSIHNLHDDSVDLHTEIHTLLRDFSFCPVEFRDDIENKPDTRITYCIIAIIKEALSNIVRHSNTTRVQIAVLEHPALYQLAVTDNGNLIAPDVISALAQSDTPAGPGIGLRNIHDRVRKLNGNVYIRTDKGFEIFVSIPKGAVHKS